MRFPSALLAFLLFVTGCTGSRQSMHTPDERSSSRGMHPIVVSDNATSLNSQAMHGVAKVYRGNTFIQSGAFVSENGLFLTNYPIALEYFTTNTQEPNNWLTTGIFANTPDEEIPLPGIMLLVLLEQQDITEQFVEHLPESGSNYEYSLAKQQLANEIIQQRKGTREDLLVQINEMHSGNEQMLNVYQIINDVRLVYAPPVNISADELTNSNALNEALLNQTVYVRAYHSPDSSISANSEFNIPYQPQHVFQLATEDNKGSHKSIALGFPDRTFRQETKRAINFYYSETNPYIIKAYEAFLEKEDYLAASNPSYAIQSLANRFHIAHTLNHYYNVQSALSGGSVLQKKDSLEMEFIHWVRTDSVRGNHYRDLMYYIDQAYDIAEQQGASFYLTSYAMALSALDDLVSQANAILQPDEDSPDDLNSEANAQSVARTMLSQLRSYNLDAELDLLKDFMLIFATFPQDEQIFFIQSVFDGVPEEMREQRAVAFIQNNARSSVLFNAERLPQALLDQSIHDDSLYQFLDEIIFTNQMARNNQNIYMAYLQPAQQVYNRALLEKDSLGLAPDANGTLRFNEGQILEDHPESSARFMITNNDFSGKAPGSVLLNQQGHIIGIIGDESSGRVQMNYLYLGNETTQKAIRSSFLLDQLGNAVPASLASELGLQN
jgi:hypothetical protein